jgi:hypothetical protein
MGSQTLTIFMTLYRCIFDQFHYVDRVHSLHILKLSTTRAISIPMLRKYLKYTCAFLEVTCEAGELLVSFKFAYLGITFLARQCLLK